MVKKNWFGQFGTIDILVALSEIVFCNTFSMKNINMGKNLQLPMLILAHTAFALWDNTFLYGVVLNDSMNFYIHAKLLSSLKH